MILSHVTVAERDSSVTAADPGNSTGVVCHRLQYVVVMRVNISSETLIVQAFGLHSVAEVVFCCAPRRGLPSNHPSDQGRGRAAGAALRPSEPSVVPLSWLVSAVLVSTTLQGLPGDAVGVPSIGYQPCRVDHRHGNALSVA